MNFCNDVLGMANPIKTVNRNHALSVDITRNTDGDGFSLTLTFIGYLELGHLIQRNEIANQKQECIPVGCVPPAR